MLLGKIVNGEPILVEVENGKEVDGNRSESELLSDGYKPACPYLGSETDETTWSDYGTCLVQEPVITEEQEPETDPDEIDAEEALRIITGE